MRREGDSRPSPGSRRARRESLAPPPSRPRPAKCGGRGILGRRPALAVLGANPLPGIRCAGLMPRATRHRLAAPAGGFQAGPRRLRSEPDVTSGRQVPFMTWSIKMDPSTGEEYIAVTAGGAAVLLDPATNKGTAFPVDERAHLHLEGLVPAAVSTIDQQLERVYENYRAKTTDLERYIHLASLQDRNETLVLPSRPRSSRRDDAGPVHAGRRRGVPAVLTHLPAPARAVYRLRAARPDRRHPRQPPLPARGHRRHRRRAHSRPRRSGCRRHGDPHRQAVSVHGLRGHSAAPDAADHARRGHGQRGAAERSAVSRPAPPADSGTASTRTSSIASSTP